MWEQYGTAPFRLTEWVARTWDFVPTRDGDGSIVLDVDVASDEVVWESGTEMKFLCVGCGAEMEIKGDVEVFFG
jgi:hypothetical protein